MAIRRQFDQRYASFWRSLANFMRQNTGLGIGGIARSGSRKRGDYRPTSDLDVIFWIPGDPRKDQVYPDLVPKLKRILNVIASIGTSYNVINITKEKLDVDLVLVSEWEFQDEHRRDQLEML